MKRRDLLKTLSLSLGCVVAAPALLSVFSSCNVNDPEWKPYFLSETQKYVIDHLVDIILPKSATPGGQELNITRFIDVIIDNTVDKEEQILFNLGSVEFTNKFKTMFKKDPLKGSKTEFSIFLNIYFKISKEEEKELFRLLELDFKEVPEQNKHSFLIYKFLTLVRYYSLFGYYTSQTILEDVLEYNPIPGSFEPCVPV